MQKKAKKKAIGDIRDELEAHRAPLLLLHEAAKLLRITQGALLDLLKDAKLIGGVRLPATTDWLPLPSRCWQSLNKDRFKVRWRENGKWKFRRALKIPSWALDFATLQSAAKPPKDEPQSDEISLLRGSNADLRKLIRDMVAAAEHSRSLEVFVRREDLLSYVGEMSTRGRDSLIDSDELWSEIVLELAELAKERPLPAKRPETQKAFAKRVIERVEEKWPTKDRASWIKERVSILFGVLGWN